MRQTQTSHRHKATNATCNIKTCTFLNKISSWWMQSRAPCLFSNWKSCLFGYLSYFSIKMGFKCCFVNLKLFWTFLLDEFWISGSFSLSDIRWYQVFSHMHVKPAKCADGPVRSIKPTYCLGGSVMLVLHLTWIFAGKLKKKILRFAHVSSLLRCTSFILYPSSFCRQMTRKAGGPAFQPHPLQLGICPFPHLYSNTLHLLYKSPKSSD